ncbi:lipid-A-disaccharide synthase [Oleiphilus messinensis]|uniref:Lipid-A-disaccharide synthase n=1 Tax=Oleiphilus messinensis TaxID=141451 RepID=A0A1Y0I6D6_9GAMM|nr:lipid-A-disaccharide synthase [Oleiphilus messinensis]ARU56057.1 lipid-A-disaccharide synthase [Oleiphilus messinensis]
MKLEAAPAEANQIRIGIVAGEASGDILGAGLIRELKQHFPDAIFEGIGGPEMISEGFNSFFPMERLSVMGLVEVLGRIFELIGIRKSLKRHFLSVPPDVFIGIDSPDFTLGLELALRRRGIKTVHYVSPSVWAWRQKRIFKIAKATDLMLTLFPFEAKFYKEHQVPVKFVGHPLADMIPFQTNQLDARKRLALPESETIVALLPGSRSGEIHYLGDVFLESANLIAQKCPGVKFIIPYVNDERRQQIEALLKIKALQLPVTLISGKSRDVMAASDVVLMASGTATLEAMLLKKPMVVAYRMSALTYFIMSKLMKAPYIALPNLLAGSRLVPELIQAQASPENLAREVLIRLEDQSVQNQVQSAFLDLHQGLKQDASKQAGAAVANLIKHKPA